MKKMTSTSQRNLGLVSRSAAREPQITLFSDPTDLQVHHRFSLPDGPGVTLRPPSGVIHPEMMEEDPERWDGMA